MVENPIPRVVGMIVQIQIPAKTLYASFVLGAGDKHPECGICSVRLCGTQVGK
jgi:hypothetical protein